MQTRLLSIFLCYLFFINIGSLSAQSASIEGHITSSETNKAIQQVNIYLSKYEGSFSTGVATDENGYYRFEGLQKGRYELTLSAVGFKQEKREIKLQTSETKTIDLTLQPARYKLNEIIVSNSNRNASNTTTVQRIDAEDIKKVDLGTVADVARLLPAAHVATNSRGQTILYLRNSADRQTAQFFNGALINVPWDNRVDISFLPSSMLGGVTVSKGVPSVTYGANTIGGAVNFRAKSLPNDREKLTKLSVTGSMPGLGGASVVRMGQHNSLSYTAEVGYTKQYDYMLPDGATVPHSQPSDDRRVNTDKRNVNMFFEGTKRYQNGARLNASIFHVDAEKGVAPESNLDPEKTGVRYWRYPAIRQSMVIVNGLIPLNSDTHLRGAMWFNRYEQDIHQFQSVAYDTLDQTQDDLDLTGGLRLILDQELGKGNINVALNVLTTQHNQTIVPYSGGNAQGDSSDTYGQQIYSLGAEYSFPIAQDLSGMVGISYEGSAITNTGPWENEGYEHYLRSALSISGGLTYEISEQLRLRSSLGRKPRFPTMRELYGGALGKFVPNPNLKPVTAYLGELGIEWRGTAVSGSLTGFITRTYDAIDKKTFQQGPNTGKEQRINLDGSRVWGIESKFSAVPVTNLSIDGSITYMNKRGILQGEPRKLDEKPTWLGKLGITYDLTDRISILSQTEYTGGIYTRTEQNTFVLLPDALIFDGRLGYDLFPQHKTLEGSELFFRVNNITNDLRVLQLGLPGPGRKFLAGAKVQF
ncbi:TonB-dependent receptor [Fodinibius halophilus]|uniref:TonB-dependent receptor n=1 Tax=Fodinibius halophilus TaxID=1736908 RepID=A0A6M1TG91_9BACT|nr:TonB-dependent receptor [Fodinibius halophilus]NGP89122.1 TonB-dependent receptor [Fodinibius halophilus]